MSMSVGRRRALAGLVLALLALGRAFGEPTAADLALLHKYEIAALSAAGLAPARVDGDWKGYRLPDSTFLWVEKDGFTVADTPDKAVIRIFFNNGKEVERDLELPSGRTCRVLPGKNPEWGLAKEAAPDFTLAAPGSGSTLRLADLKGKVVLLDFWASWCQPCMQSLPQTEARYEKYKDRGLVVLGVNIEGDSAKASAAAASLGLTFPVLMSQPDDRGAYNWASRQIADFRVHWIPYMFLIDRNGIVQKADEVSDRDVEAVLAGG